MAANQITSQRSVEFAARYRKAAISLVVAVLLLAATAIYLVFRDREQVWSTARRNQQDFAIALQLSMTDLLSQSVFSLRGIQADLQENTSSARSTKLDRLRLAMRFDPLSAYLGIKTQQGVLIVDRYGEAASRIGDQRMPEISVGSATDTLALGPLLRLAGDSTWYLPLSMRSSTSDEGESVVFALVPIPRLLAGASSLRVLPGSMVTLFTTDGVRLLRYQLEQDVLEPNGKPVPAEVIKLVSGSASGSFARKSTVDGRPTIYGYSRSQYLPLVVAPGVPESSLQQQWVSKAAAPVIVLTVGLGLIAMIGLSLRNALREQRDYVRDQEYMATHDQLTGLPNRYAFLRFVDDLILRSGPDASFYVLLIDLNNFKDVNDTLGHAAGDAVLVALGHRLGALLADHPACVARLGGDEIAICDSFAGTAVPEAPTHLCEEIQSALKIPLTVDGVELTMTASVGVAAFPLDAKTSKDLLRCADIAMYSSKADMLPHRRYSETMDHFSPSALAMKAEFAKAIREDTLTLVYQPKLRLEDLGLVGLEALSRWVDPIKGPVSPARFMPLAENTELIHPFTELVLANAVRQIARWLAQGYEVPVAVNISANNLLEQNFAEGVRQRLIDCGVPARLLELEITETAVMRYPELMLQRLQQIRDIGVKLSIDDFGTGYASLAYLKQLPVDALKIDKAFITNIDSDQGDRRIVKSSIQLAHGFGMTVIAEGVESQAVMEFLRAEGCDCAQGFHFSKPVSVAEIESQWLSKLARASDVPA